MKKILFVAVFLTSVIFSSVSLSAQNSIEVFDGNTLQVGDTVRIGHRSSSNLYRNIKERVVNDYGRIEFRDFKDDLSFVQAKIVELIPQGEATMFYKQGPVIVVKPDTYQRNLFVNIDPAVERGEVISSYMDHSGRKEILLTDDLLLACCLRVNQIPISDYALQTFIKIKDKELSRKCQADEFEFHQAKPVYEKMLRELMDGFDFSATYYVISQIGIDKYDFDKKGYPLGLFKDQSELVRHFLKYGDYNFQVVNREECQFVPVTMEEGAKINKRRKGLGNAGYISSLVYGRVYMRLLDQKMVLPKSDIINVENLYRHRVIGAKITGIEVYDFQHCDYNLIGIVKP